MANLNPFGYAPVDVSAFGNDPPVRIDRDPWGRLPTSAPDDRRANPEPLVEPGITVPYRGPWQFYKGTLAPGPDIPPADITNPLSREAGAQDIATTPIGKLLREIWFPGADVSMPLEQLIDLYAGNGPVAVTAKRLHPDRSPTEMRGPR